MSEINITLIVEYCQNLPELNKANDIYQNNNANILIF